MSLQLNGHTIRYHRPRYNIELRNTRWVPVFIKKASLDRMATRESFLQLAKDGSLQGFGGYNEYNGPYGAEQERLFVGPILPSRMYCLNMDYESAFLGALSGSNNYLVVEDQLYLFKEKSMQGAFKAMYYH